MLNYKVNEAPPLFSLTLHLELRLMEEKWSKQTSKITLQHLPIFLHCQTLASTSSANLGHPTLLRPPPLTQWNLTKICCVYLSCRKIYKNCRNLDSLLLKVSPSAKIYTTSSWLVMLTKAAVSSVGSIWERQWTNAPRAAMLSLCFLLHVRAHPHTAWKQPGDRQNLCLILFLDRACLRTHSCDGWFWLIQMTSSTSFTHTRR